MIFVDSNVPMYLVGNAHPNRDRVPETLAHLSEAQERFVTDIEVYQEILHRYTAIRRSAAIDRAFNRLNEITEEVLAFGITEILAAKDLINSVPGISARDALHVAVMRTAGITRILSYDTGYDTVPGIERLERQIIN